MSSKPITAMASRIQLLPRSLTTSYSTSGISTTVARRASTRSISSLTRHQSHRQTSLLPALPTAQVHTSPATQSLTSKHHIRLESTSAKSPDSSTPEIKSYNFEDITSATAKPEQILIDVREPPELLSTGIIPTSRVIPIASQPDAYFLTPDEFLTRFGFPKPGYENGEEGSSSSSSASNEEEPKIVFYCKAGVRARAAAQLAVKAGYKPENLGVYDGSWLDWEKRGGKVERWDGEED